MKACFYRILPKNPTKPDFGVFMQSLVDRYFSSLGHYEDYDDYGLRIERFSYLYGHYSGDLVKQQKNDIPPLAQEGLALQPSKVPIGHRCAFLYHPETRAFVMESNKSGISAGSFMKFITRLNGASDFSISPIIDKKTFDHLNAGQIRKLTLKYATAENISVFENEGTDLGNLEKMRNGFNGPSLEISIGFDTPKRGYLSHDRVIDFVRKALGKSEVIKKLEAKDETGDILNLLGHLLKHSENVKLPSDDIDLHYKNRSNFLLDAIKKHRNFIQNQFIGSVQ